MFVGGACDPDHAACDRFPVRRDDRYFAILCPLQAVKPGSATRGCSNQKRRDEKPGQSLASTVAITTDVGVEIHPLSANNILRIFSMHKSVGSPSSIHPF